MQDPYAGQGGSYLLDPKTGKRTRIEAPTEHPSEDASLLDNGVAEPIAAPQPKHAKQGE